MFLVSIYYSLSVAHWNYILIDPIKVLEGIPKKNVQNSNQEKRHIPWDGIRSLIKDVSENSFSSNVLVSKFQYNCSQFSDLLWAGHKWQQLIAVHEQLSNLQIFLAHDQSPRISVHWKRMPLPTIGQPASFSRRAGSFSPRGPEEGWKPYHRAFKLHTTRAQTLFKVWNPHNFSSGMVNIKKRLWRTDLALHKMTFKKMPITFSMPTFVTAFAPSPYTPRGIKSWSTFAAHGSWFCFANSQYCFTWEMGTWRPASLNRYAQVVCGSKM